MIKLQGTDKLQYYFEMSSWWVMETILKFRKTYRSILKYRYMIPSLTSSGEEARTARHLVNDDNLAGLVGCDKGHLFYPTALKGCRGIVFTHGVEMGGRAGGRREKVCPGCISETVRCRKLILGRDIG